MSRRLAAELWDPKLVPRRVARGINRESRSDGKLNAQALYKPSLPESLECLGQQMTNLGESEKDQSNG